jgi:hypothetical protein
MLIGQIEEIGVIEPIELPRTLPAEVEPAEARPAEEPVPPATPG